MIMVVCLGHWIFHLAGRFIFYQKKKQLLGEVLSSQN